MKQAANTYSSKNKIALLEVLIVSILLIIFSGYIFYQLIPKNNNTFIPFSKQKLKIYLLQSTENEAYLNKNGFSLYNYENQLSKISGVLKEMGYSVEKIDTDDIRKLKPSDTLFALDTYSVSKQTIEDLKNFMNKGGNLIFNYHFGYAINNKFVKAKNIESITNLKYNKEILSEKKVFFYINKLLSPLNADQLDTKKEMVLYSNDVIPLFTSKTVPDMVLTNWEITSFPFVNNKMLSIYDAGIMWHGFYGKGKWVYFSYPAYVLLDMKKSDLVLFLENILTYVTKKYILLKYPFLDFKNAVFISEDTEFKYESLENFSKTANEMKIPVTAFCVASLAEKNREMTKKASQLPYIEIGSHSYSHSKIVGEPMEKMIKEIAGSKEIIEKITGKQIYGFRPPREEINADMVKLLKKAGYVYVMEHSKPYLLPKEEYPGIITIPRHGTDDYIYLIELDWDKEKILKKIIQETQMLTKLNSIFTLSVHTHLLSYKSNLEILKKYFAYLNKHKELKPLKGIDIAKRYIWNKNITLSMQELNKKTFIYIANKNAENIKNFTLRIYWPNSKKIKISPEMSRIKFKIIKNNEKEKFTDIQIFNLKPKSSISLIIDDVE